MLRPAGQLARPGGELISHREKMIKMLKIWKWISSAAEWIISHPAPINSKWTV